MLPSTASKCLKSLCAAQPTCRARQLVWNFRMPRLQAMVYIQTELKTHSTRHSYAVPAKYTAAHLFLTEDIGRPLWFAWQQPSPSLLREIGCNAGVILPSWDFRDSLSLSLLTLQSHYKLLRQGQLMQFEPRFSMATKKLPTTLNCRQLIELIARQQRFDRSPIRHVQNDLVHEGIRKKCWWRPPHEPACRGEHCEIQSVGKLSNSLGDQMLRQAPRKNLPSLLS